MAENNFLARREQMVKEQLIARGIEDDRVLEAFRTIPREKFVPEDRRREAYRDGPLPIGEGQTISQPYIVALMVEALKPKAEDKILEIGTGSGYAAAILSRLVAAVHGVERYETLAEGAEEKLDQLDCSNVQFHVGDGTKGWPPAAPYDGILVSAAAPGIPESLMEQLKPGGGLVIPAGSKNVQDLYQVEKSAKREINKNKLGKVRFVPLIGANGW